MLKYLNEELQTKEICVLFKRTSSEKDKVKFKNRAGYTAICLHCESYESESDKCVYCSENHSPSQCKKVTNRESQIDILKKSDTPLKRVLQNMFVENAMEKHHISTCDKGENRNSHAT